MWGYYLGRYIYAPLRQWLPASVAVLLTFAVSGFIHDLAVWLVKGFDDFFFTQWFCVMALIVVAGKGVNIRWGNLPFIARALLNLSLISVSGALVALPG